MLLRQLHGLLNRPPQLFLFILNHFLLQIHHLPGNLPRLVGSKLRQARTLQSIKKENSNGIHDLLGAGRVMVSFDHRQVLVSSVLLIQLLSMVRLDEVVTCGCDEISRDEGLLHVVNGIQLRYIEVGFVLNGFPYELHGCGSYSFRNFRIIPSELFRKYS